MAKIIPADPAPPPPVTVEFTEEEFRFVVRLITKAYRRDWLTSDDDDRASDLIEHLDPTGSVRLGLRAYDDTDLG